MTRVEGLSADARQLLRVVGRGRAHRRPRLLAAVGRARRRRARRARWPRRSTRRSCVVDPSRSGYRFRHELLARRSTARCCRASAAGCTARWPTALTADPSLGPPGPGTGPPSWPRHWWAAGEWAAGARRVDRGGRRRRAPCGPSRRRSPTSSAPCRRSTACPAARRRRRRSPRAAGAGLRRRLPGRRRPALGRSGPRGDRRGRRRRPTRRRVARYYVLLGRNAWAIGDSDGAFDAYRRAAALVPADPPSVELARVLAEEARGLMLMSRFAEAEQRCREALAVARRRRRPGRGGPRPLHAGLLPGLARHYDEGIELVREALAIAEELGRAPTTSTGPTGPELPARRVGPARGGRRAGVRQRGRGRGALGRAAERRGRQQRRGAHPPGPHRRGRGAARPDRRPRASAAAPPALRAAGARWRSAAAASTRPPSTLADGRRADGAARRRAAPGRVPHAGRRAGAAARVDPSDAYEASSGRWPWPPAPTTRRTGPRCAPWRCAAWPTGSTRPAPEAGASTSTRPACWPRGSSEEADAVVAAAPAARGGRCPPRTRAFAAMCAAEASRLHESDPELWAEAAAPVGRRRRALSRGLLPLARSRGAARGPGRAGRAERRASRRPGGSSVELGVRPLAERIERLAQRARIPLPPRRRGEPDDGADRRRATSA